MTDKIPTQDITPVDAGKKRKSPTNNHSADDLYARRKHIYVKRVQGLFQKLRASASWVLLAGFFLASFMNYEGRQALLFDLPNRQFHFFGTTIFPHDFMLLAWLLIILAFVLFFVTNFAGRVWCGYSCPQFVWTWIFIFVEDKLEGSPNQRKKLDKAPWSANKLLRKGGKHLIWLMIAVVTGIAFLGYFSPIRELIPRVLTLDLGLWEGFWMGFFIFFTYLFAGWLREQVCIYMCPYARFQAVMFDKDTLIVSYDEACGEPRGSRKKSADPKALNLGSCIDCDLCVQVCPVGIDIRNGLQYECISCAACIDACDQVMDKMDYPRGLISYTTEERLAGRTTKFLRPRLIGYFTVLMAMSIAFIIAVSGRVPLELEVLRDRNQLFRMTNTGQVENSYLIRIANMDQKPHTYELSLRDAKGIELDAVPTFSLAGGEVRQFPIQLLGDLTQLPQLPAVDIKVHLVSQDDPSIQRTRDSRFIIRQAR